MGCTRTPNPVSRSSHAIQDLSAGLRPSTARLVSASLVLAMRFPIFASMAQLCIWTPSSQHLDQHMKITLGASVRMSGEIGYEKRVENPYFMECLSSSAHSCAPERKITRETYNLKAAGSNPTPATK